MNQVRKGGEGFYLGRVMVKISRQWKEINHAIFGKKFELIANLKNHLEGNS